MKADQFLFLHRHFDKFDPKINVLSGSDKRKENELFVCNNMDCTEAIVNNRSVKTVRKLQVSLLPAARVSPYFFRALAASCVLYNRTEHNRGFFICYIKHAYDIFYSFCRHKESKGLFT